MQYSQEHLKTMVYAKFGGKQKIENSYFLSWKIPYYRAISFAL